VPVNELNATASHIVLDQRTPFVANTRMERVPKLVRLLDARARRAIRHLENLAAVQLVARCLA